jgi:aminodeoxyfutalosine deaminase
MFNAQVRLLMWLKNGLLCSMGYAKFRAHQLFDGYNLREDDAVLVTTEDGIVDAIVPIADAGDNVQILTGILSPGFINCHCHLELSHMKAAIPEGTGLVSFVSQVMQNRHVAEEKIREAIGKAEDEMFGNGIVAVGDICNNTLTIPQKMKRRIRYHNFIEASGFHPAIAEERFQRAVSIFNEYTRQLAITRSSNSIVPHSPYSVSDPLWKKIIHFPGNHLMCIHNQESPVEDELFITGQGDLLKLYHTLGIDISFFKASGKTSLQTYLHHFTSNQQLILVHNVCTKKNDLDILGSAAGPINLFFCLCPNANLYITGKLPPVEMLYKENVRIVLGTDSIASNRQLSILAEMKTIQQNFPAIQMDELFKWATLNGAQALGMDNVLGSFEKGKQPGVILVNKDLSGTKRIL